MVILLQSPSQPLFPNRVLLQFFVKSIVSVNTTETMLCTLWAKYYIVIMFFFLYNFFPLWPNCLTFSFALFSLSLQVFLSVHTSFPPPSLSSPPSLIPFLLPVLPSLPSNCCSGPVKCQTVFQEHKCFVHLLPVWTGRPPNLTNSSSWGGILFVTFLCWIPFLPKAVSSFFLIYT